jgi:hypothetical protein
MVESMASFAVGITNSEIVRCRNEKANLWMYDLLRIGIVGVMKACF